MNRSPYDVKHVIVRHLAEGAAPALYRGSPLECYECALCGSSADNAEHIEHDELCLWVRAKAAMLPKKRKAKVRR